MKIWKSNKKDVAQASTSQSGRGRRKTELEKFRDEIEIKNNNTPIVAANKKLLVNYSISSYVGHLRKDGRQYLREGGFSAVESPRIKWQSEKAGNDVETGAAIRDENGKKNWEQDPGDNEEEGEGQHEEKEVGYRDSIATLERQMRKWEKRLSKAKKKDKEFRKCVQAVFSKFEEVVEESNSEVKQYGDDRE
ncbi:hypothetical protein M9H77_21938 [Catharanthus roseus]|uniref:Uncharacterized protein n=1 Tax=Catharanthus roseus TaxID=4058 RepID=A0ACC0AQS8_CATRO|nr:hypothetical protein M9H77_21938 [Catharanthus roseus]